MGHIGARCRGSIQADRGNNVFRPIKANARTRFFYKLLKPICHTCKVKKRGEPLPPAPTKPKYEPALEVYHLEEWFRLLCVVKVTTHSHDAGHDSVNFLALAVLLLCDLDVIGLVTR